MKNLIKIIITVFLFVMISCKATVEIPQKNSQKNEEEKTMQNAGREIVVIETKFGNIEIDFFEKIAPKHVENFKNLTKEKFYDSLYFHRVIPGFMVQGGCPNTRDNDRSNDGMGLLNQKTVPAEFSSVSHKRGIVSMARKGNDVNSGTSQFFICVADCPQLDGQYSVFGKVINGMDVVDKIVNEPRDERDNPNVSVYMQKVYVKKVNIPEPEENKPLVNPEPNMGDLAVLETSLGNITFEFYNDVAPKHVAQIKKLIEEHFYDSTTFHRVIPGFMIQGGDPNSKDNDRSNDGMGSSNLPNIPAEFSKLHHLRGIVSAARAQDPNTANCQFFICVADVLFLDNQYSIFGKVIDGMDVADKIVNVPRDGNDNPNEKVVIKKFYLKKNK